jgi:hypothetical protein
MNRVFLVLIAAATLAVAGCGGDVAQQMTSNPEFRSQAMAAIAGNGELAGAMVDSLLSGESGRAVLTDRVLANGVVVQDMIGRMAKDQTSVDAMINLAVQDTAMRAHVLAMFKGMQMVGAK